MQYLIFTAVAMVTVAIMCVVGARFGVIDTGNKVKLYKPCKDEEFVPFKGILLILIMTVCFAVALVMQILLYKNTSVVNFVKLYGLFLIIINAAIIDAKRKIIPNKLVLCGFGLRMGIYAYEIITRADMKAIVINDLIGFGIGFGILAAVSVLTRGAMGFGDAKLFGVIGIISGSYCTYSTLLASLIVSAVISVIKIAKRELGRKDSFPFGPCIAIGYIISVFLTSY